MYAAVSGSMPDRGQQLEPYGGAQPGNQQQRPRGGRGGRGNRGRGNPAPAIPGGAAIREDRVGRFPGDWKKCVTATGEVICVAYQMGRCKRLVEFFVEIVMSFCIINTCRDVKPGALACGVAGLMRKHVCAVVTQMSPIMILCEGLHNARECPKKV